MTNSQKQAIRFVLHYIEMVIAMLVGMFLLAPIWKFLIPSAVHRTDTHTVLMAVDMAIGMAAWMLIRRHNLQVILEMSLAMILPFLVLLVPYWFGLLSGSGVMSLGHVLMLIAMLVVMLGRREEYVGHHHGSPSTDGSAIDGSATDAPLTDAPVTGPRTTGEEA